MNSGDINCVSSVLKARWGWGTGPLRWLYAVHNWFCGAFILGPISMAGLWRWQTWQIVINMEDSLSVMNEWLSKVINFFGLLRKTGWYSSLWNMPTKTTTSEPNLDEQQKKDVRCRICTLVSFKVQSTLVSWPNDQLRQVSDWGQCEHFAMCTFICRPVETGICTVGSTILPFIRNLWEASIYLVNK